MGDNQESDDSNPYSVTEEMLQNRIRQTQSGRKITQYYCGFVGMLSMVSFGTSLGWSGPQMKLNEFDEMTEAWIAGMFPLGCSIGFISWTFLTARFGPKKILINQAPFNILTLAVMTFVSSHSVYMCGRFFLGFFEISLILCGESLLNETIHRSLIRRIKVLFTSSILLGVLVVNVWAFTLSRKVSTAICMSLPAIHFFLLMFLPESPVFLYKTSESAARESMAWYRGKRNIYMSMKDIKADYDYNRLDPDTYKDVLYSKAVIRGMLIIFGVVIVDILSGYHLLIFYTIYFWHTQEHNVINPIIDSVIITSCLYLSNLIWQTIHLKWHMHIRKGLIISSFLTAVSLLVLSIYLGLHTWNVVTVSWLPLAATAFLIISYDIGLGHHTKILILTYMPIQVYKKAVSLIFVTLWFFVFVVITFFVKLVGVVPLYIVLGGMAVLQFLGTLYLFIFIIEPTGKSLIQIQLEIGGNPIGTRGIQMSRTLPNI